ncbi:MAG: FtsX-like permease family protein [Anaerolineae bacterium]|nr:FtsX-like permease family protein [Anaerolineae bacterium]
MFQPVLLRLALRWVSRRLFQSLLFIVGVALGVAVVIAIDLANGSASRAFALSGESITGRATHQITGGVNGLPTALYTQLRRELGLRDSAPIINELVRAVETGGRPLRLLGVDPFAEPPFRTYLETIRVVSEGSAEGDEFAALTRFISEPGSVLLSQSLADRYSLQPGDGLTLRAGARRVPVTIIGVLQPEDRASQQALDDLLLTDIATAQEITGQSGFISRIDLILPPDFDQAQITSRLPAGASLATVQESGSALQQMTAAFEINLQALSLLAVVVGVFLIYNTVSFSVVQRRPVIGILRSLGATKPQIFALVIGEAFVLGFIGTVLGMALGILFGRLMVGLVAQTITDLFFAVNVTTITVNPLTLLKGAALGLAASVGAAFIPSVDATRTPPVGSMKRSSAEDRMRHLLPALAAGGVLFPLAGYALLQIPTADLFLSFAALFCVIFGGALLVPVALVPAMTLVAPLTGRLFGVVGRMSPRAITRSLSRTAIAVAALTIAVSVIVGVSVMIGSFRSTVADWLNNTLGADIFIAPPALNANQAGADVAAAVREVVAAVPGIERVSAARSVKVPAPDYPDLLPVNLQAVDYEISRERDFVWTTAPGGDLRAALDAGQIMVSEPFAFRRGLTPERNTLRLLTDAGVQTFTVFGVFYDYSTDQGTVIMGRATYDAVFDDRAISTLAAYIAPGADLDAVIENVRQALADYDLQVQSNRSLREGVFAIFERTFTITIALRLLATLVAFIGILAALLALQLEQTREYGVLRATGMSVRQLWQYTLLQTGLMGTLAGLLALPIGLVLALVLIFVINVRSFGWTMQLALLPEDFALAFAVAVVAALLAGLYPAWKLGRLNTTRALRSE